MVASVHDAAAPAAKKRVDAARQAAQSAAGTSGCHCATAYTARFLPESTRQDTLYGLCTVLSVLAETALRKRSSSPAVTVGEDVPDRPEQKVWTGSVLLDDDDASRGRVDTRNTMAKSGPANAKSRGRHSRELDRRGTPRVNLQSNSFLRPPHVVTSTSLCSVMCEVLALAQESVFDLEALAHDCTICGLYGLYH